MSLPLHSTNAILATFVSLKLFTIPILACNFVQVNNSTYYPLNICIFDNTFAISFNYQCHGQQAYEIIYSSTDCTSPVALNHTSYITNFHCSSNINCDYVTYSEYPGSPTGIQCQNLGETPNSNSEVINQCLYLPQYQVYQRTTCLRTLISTAYYQDSNCSDELSRNNGMDRCRPNAITYTDITTCTDPINNLHNQCGYAQLSSNDILRPLNVCNNYKNGGYSFLFSCINGAVYGYQWFNNHCGATADAVDNVTVTPMAFSCSTEQCEYSILRMIQNNQCQDISNVLNTEFDAIGVVVNKCFNWFDDDTSLKSNIYYCNDTALIGVEYDKGDCTGSEHITELYTETCSSDDSTQHRIECFGSTDQKPTSSPIVTVNPIYTNTSTKVDTSFPTTTPIVETPAPTTENKRIVYVSKYGSDKDLDCYIFFSAPCGTLLKAVKAVHLVFQWDSFSNVTDWEIIVRGQNTEDFDYWISLGYNPCKPYRLTPMWYILDEMTLTITFDPRYIQSLHDWYDVDVCEHDSVRWSSHFFDADDFAVGTFPFTLILNNLVFDSYIFEGREMQPTSIANVHHFICNNCTFSNITIDSNHHSLLESKPSALIFGESAAFYDCIIEDIKYIPASNDVYNYSFVTVTDEISAILTLTLQDSIVEDISMLSTFANTYYSDTLSLEGMNISVWNTMFYDIFIMDALFYVDISETLDISITSSTFYIEFGSIFYETELMNSQIVVVDVNISTHLTIEQYFDYITSARELETDMNHPSALFRSDSLLSSIYIDRVKIEYKYAEYIREHCLSDYTVYETIWFWHYQVSLHTRKDLGFMFFLFKCEAPVEFIYSLGSIYMYQVSVTNDITYTVIKSFRDDVINQVHIHGPYPQDLIYVNFWFWDDNDRDIAFIYSDGTLDIESLFVYGAGIHDYLILSPNGDVTINNLITFPETYCVSDDDECEYDSDTLLINRFISIGVSGALCSTNQLKVTNSYMYGSKQHAITIGTGYATLQNVTIQKAASAIIADKDVIRLTINACNFIDIGSYYASSLYFLSSYYNLFIPMLFAPMDLYIEDSLFSYVNPYQFDMFDPQAFEDVGYFGSDVVEIRKITLINNIFEINDENVVVAYPINHSMHYIDDVEWGRHLFDENYTVEFDLSRYFLLDGMMNIPEKTQLMMINNKLSISESNIYVNDSILIDIDIAWISVENKVSHCMSGNEFSNFAVWMKDGNITSCFRNEMINYFDVEGCDLYGTFGAISDLSLAGKANVFHVTNDEISIIRVEQDAFIALDNNIINIYDEYIADILNITSGNYLLTDTAINTVEYDIIVHQDCGIRCYSMLDNDPKQISVLHITCDQVIDTSANSTHSINGLYDAQSTSASSPYSITVSTQNNGSYFPGDKLLLNYSIFDIERNEIDGMNQDIVAYFESDNIVFQVNIDSNGNCKECIHGVSFPSLTLQDIGNSYSFNGQTQHNYLVLEGTLNLTVALCPPGYGSTGTLQCDVCSKGFVSLLPSNTSCIYCDENQVDGISCPGYNNITVHYNYWAAVNGYDGIQDVFGNSDAYIVSAKCPNSYCCQSTEECDFINDRDILCARNRDINAALCGQCVAGYSEVFGSVDCVKCSRNFWERLVLPIIYGLLWSIFILLTTQTKVVDTVEDTSYCTCCEKIHRKKSNNDSQENNNYKFMRKEYLSCCKIMVTKILIYYYQSISYILTINGATTTLYGFVNLFNLDIFSVISSSSGKDNTVFCLLENMSAPQKISLPLVSTASILFFILLPYLCSLCCPIICFDRKPNFGQAFIKASFIIVGQLLSNLFTLLSCRRVGDVDVHYFFGSQRCFSNIWMISLVALCFIFLCFVALFIYIWIQHRNTNGKEDKDGPYYPVIWCFKDSCYLWECILLLRRCIFALVFIVIDNNDLRLSICILSLIFLFIQLNHSPFKWEDANRLESYLIAAVCMIIFVDISASNEMYRDIVLSLLILLPLVWFIYFVVSNCGSLQNHDIQRKMSALKYDSSGSRSDSDLENNLRTIPHQTHELVPLERGSAGGNSVRL